ncbi:MAG: class I SAM-dependent methyltransferase [Pirellulaceae bacterium]
MPLDRVLEPEVMDTFQEAFDYDTMDHSAVNRLFVEDLLATLTSSKFQVESSKLDAASSTLNLEPGTLNLDVLDLGAGTAQIPIELCRQLATCRVMACDASVSMLEQAQYNLAGTDLNDRIVLRQADCKALPFQETKFDVVMSNSIVHHIPEPLAVLREAIRVVRLGGLLFFRDLVRPESLDQLGHFVDTYAADTNDHQRRMFAASLHAALSLDEIRALIVSLGFAAESVQQTSDRHWTWVASATSENFRREPVASA